MVYADLLALLPVRSSYGRSHGPHTKATRNPYDARTLVTRKSYAPAIPWLWERAASGAECGAECGAGAVDRAGTAFAAGAWGGGAGRLLLVPVYQRVPGATQRGAGQPDVASPASRGQPAAGYQAGEGTELPSRPGAQGRCDAGRLRAVWDAGCGAAAGADPAATGAGRDPRLPEPTAPGRGGRGLYRTARFDHDGPPWGDEAAGPRGAGRAWRVCAPWAAQDTAAFAVRRGVMQVQDALSVAVWVVPTLLRG